MPKTSKPSIWGTYEIPEGEAHGDTKTLDEGQPLPWYVARKIYKRWMWWQPTVRSRKIPQDAARDRHREFILQALRMGLSMDNIKKNNLDSPALEANDQQELLKQYVQDIRRRSEGRSKARAPKSGKHGSVSSLSLLRD